MEWLQNSHNMDEYGYIPVKKDDLYSYMKHEHNIDKEDVNHILNRFENEEKIHFVGCNKVKKQFEHLERNCIVLQESWWIKK